MWVMRNIMNFANIVMILLYGAFVLSFCLFMGASLRWGRPTVGDMHIYYWILHPMYLIVSLCFEYPKLSPVNRVTYSYYLHPDGHCRKYTLRSMRLTDSVKQGSRDYGMTKI